MLLNAHLGALTISLDGLGEEHDWMRCVYGSFDKASAAIRMAAKKDRLAFGVVTCINRKNSDLLYKTRNFLINAGVRFQASPKAKQGIHSIFVMQA